MGAPVMNNEDFNYYANMKVSDNVIHHHFYGDENIEVEFEYDEDDKEEID